MLICLIYLYTSYKFCWNSNSYVQSKVKIKIKSKYPNNHREVSMLSRSKSRLSSSSSDMNVDYPFQNLVTNKMFTLKKIEEFTSEKSDERKDNPYLFLSEKSN